MIRMRIDVMKKILLIAAFILALAATAASPKHKGDARISFTSVKHDFGVVDEACGEVECDFIFTNKGSSPLIISATKTSCECTLARHSSEAVLPGHKGSIKVIYSPIGVRGNFMKNVYVYSNGSRQPITLYIKGKVRPVGR